VTTLSILSAICAAAMIISFWRQRHAPSHSIASHTIFWLFVCNMGLGISLAVLFFPTGESVAACVVSAALVDFFTLCSCMWTCVLVWLSVAVVLEKNGLWVRQKLKTAHIVLWLSATFIVAVPMAEARYCSDIRFLHIGTRPPANVWVYVPLVVCYASSFVVIGILVKYRALSNSGSSQLRRLRVWVLIFLLTWSVPIIRDSSLLGSQKLSHALRDAHRYVLAVMGMINFGLWLCLRPKIVVPRWSQVFDLALHIDPRHPSFDTTEVQPRTNNNLCCCWRPQITQDDGDSSSRDFYGTAPS